MTQQAPKHTPADDLVICQTADGWSLHAPGSTDEEIATGDAPLLSHGEGTPTPQDYAAAFREFRRRQGDATLMAIIFG